MLSTLNKLTLQNELPNCVTNNVLLDKTLNTITTKTVAGDGTWKRDLSHPKQMRYLNATESAESIDCCQTMVETYINKAERSYK